MSTDYRLHYAPDNASLAVRLALEELDLPYDTALVDRSTRGQKAPAYLNLNPNGLIPALETPDGVMFETGAILLWLADRHGGVFPAPDAPGRTRALSWLFWLANTYHPTLKSRFYPDQFPHADPDRARMRLAELNDLAEAHLAPEAEALGVTILDCYLMPMLRWSMIYPAADPAWTDLTRWPRLAALCARMEGRPSTRRLCIAEGLGAHPFTRPEHPNPPEGVAL